MNSRTSLVGCVAIAFCGAVVVAITLGLGFGDLARGDRAIATQQDLDDRAATIGSFVAYVVGAAAACWVGIMVELGTKPGFVAWRRTNVIAGTTAVVALGAIAPSYRVVVYYDALRLDEPQRVGLVALMGGLLTIGWAISALCRQLATAARHPVAVETGH